MSPYKEGRPIGPPSSLSQQCCVLVRLVKNRDDRNELGLDDDDLVIDDEVAVAAPRRMECNQSGRHRHELAAARHHNADADVEADLTSEHTFGALLDWSTVVRIDGLLLGGQIDRGAVALGVRGCDLWPDLVPCAALVAEPAFSGLGRRLCSRGGLRRLRCRRSRGPGFWLAKPAPVVDGLALSHGLTALALVSALVSAFTSRLRVGLHFRATRRWSRPCTLNVGAGLDVRALLPLGQSPSPRAQHSCRAGPRRHPPTRGPVPAIISARLQLSQEAISSFQRLPLGDPSWPKSSVRERNAE